MVFTPNKPTSCCYCYSNCEKQLWSKLYGFEWFEYISDTIFGTWFEHNQAWWDLAKKQNNIYFIFYEDLKKVRPTQALIRQFPFIQIIVKNIIYPRRSISIVSY